MARCMRSYKRALDELKQHGNKIPKDQAKRVLSLMPGLIFNHPTSESDVLDGLESLGFVSQDDKYVYIK